MGNKIGKEELTKLQEIMRSKPNLVSLCGIADTATEADLSGLGMDADNAAILASELPDKGALSKLIFGGDYGARSATLEVGMTKANFSNKKLGVGGAIIISAWLTHKDKGAILSINLLRNDIPVEQAQELVKIMQAKEKLITLCGLSKEETELDFSGQYLEPGDAVLIANDISGMGALYRRCL
jgi:hypothetical protein